MTGTRDHGGALLRTEIGAVARTLVAGTLAGILWQLAAITTPLAVARAVDDGIADGDGGRLAVWAGVIAALVAVQALASAARHRCAITAMSRGGARLRATLGARLLAAGAGRVGAARIQTLATSDVRAVTVLLDAVAHTIGYAVTLVVSLVLLALLSPLLAAAVGAAMVALGLVVAAVTPRARAGARRVQDAANATADAVSPLVTAAGVLEGVGARPGRAGVARRASGAQRRAGLSLARTEAALTGAAETLPGIALAGALLAGGLLVEDGSLTAGELAAALAYVRLLGPPMRTLPLRLLTVQTALAGATRLAALTGGGDGARPADPPRPGAGPLAIAVRGATVRRGGRTVLDRLDLDVPAGSLCVLTGPTGAGRTTLLELVAGEQTPDAGRVLVDGRDAATLDLRRRVVLVEAQPLLLRGTVREVLRLGAPEADDDALHAALEAASAQGPVARLGGLDGRVDERGATLSGGERLRLAVARALLAEPGVLLLDDVTRSLDPATETRLLDALVARRPCTVLLVSHRPAALERADRVVHLPATGAAPSPGVVA